MSKTLSLVVFILAFISCRADQRTVFEDYADIQSICVFPHQYTWPIEKNRKIADLQPHIQNVELIELTKDVANLIGDIWHVKVLKSGDLILIDRTAATITRVGRTGKLVWHVRSQDDDYRVFSSIDFFSYDTYAGEIMIASDRTIFRVGLDGRMIDQFRAPGIDWLQFERLPGDTLVYSSQTLSNPGTFDTPKQLLYTVQGKLFTGYLDQLPYRPLHNTMGGIPEFTRLDGQLIYCPSYRDTYYGFVDGVPAPAFRFEFDCAVNPNDVMLMDKVINKLEYFRNNDVPFSLKISASTERIAVHYKLNRAFYFGLATRNPFKPLFNHRFFRYGNLFFEAPYLYQDNYSARVASPEEVEHYKKIHSDATTVSDQWVTELRTIRAQARDDGSKFIYLIHL